MFTVWGAENHFTAGGFFSFATGLVASLKLRAVHGQLATPAIFHAYQSSVFVGGGGWGYGEATVKIKQRNTGKRGMAVEYEHS